MERESKQVKSQRRGLVRGDIEANYPGLKWIPFYHIELQGNSKLPIWFYGSMRSSDMEEGNFIPPHIHLDYS